MQKPYYDYGTAYARESSGVDFGKVLFTVIFLAFLLGAFFLPMFSVDAGTARHAAEASGFTDVRVRDSHYFFVAFHGCSNGDAAAFDVIAKNAQGKKVNLLVCSGWPWKGSTVRIP